MSDLFGNQIVGFPTRRLKLSLCMRKSSLRSQPCPKQTELYKRRRWLETGNFGQLPRFSMYYLANQNELPDVRSSVVFQINERVQRVRMFLYHSHLILFSLVSNQAPRFNGYKLFFMLLSAELYPAHKC